MKKYIFPAVCALLLLGSVSCDHQLDIVPLGQSILDNADDLETLLNKPYCLNLAQDADALANNVYPEKMKPLSQLFNSPNSLSYAILTGSESVDRIALTTTDNRYEALYTYINYANVIISKTGDVSGSKNKKEQIEAEARILRAWWHFLSVNLHAGQYDASTAYEAGGVPFVDNTNVQETKVKLTVQEVYDRILQDCSDEIISLLPQRASGNPSRGYADFGNAVRGLVLFQMKKYQEARPYLEKALSFNSNVEDRSQCLAAGKWELGYLSPNNYLLVRGENTNLGEYFALGLTSETSALMETNDYVMMLGDTEGWTTDNYGYGVGNDLLCLAADVHYNCYGIRTENVHYALAEILIRSGKIKEGLEHIDDVRKFRLFGYDPLAPKAGTFTESSAMQTLQNAKRLEMTATVYNFLDCKRWNSEVQYKRDIVHDYGEFGKYTIKPDSPLWIFPFPLSCTLYNNTLTQNF